MRLTAPGEVGGNIRSFRTRAGVSLVELARLSSLHQSVVSNVERGVNEPELDTAIKLAHSLGLTLGEVLRGPDGEGAGGGDR